MVAAVFHELFYFIFKYSFILVLKTFYEIQGDQILMNYYWEYTQTQNVLEFYLC